MGGVWRAYVISGGIVEPRNTSERTKQGECCCWCGEAKSKYIRKRRSTQREKIERERENRQYACLFVLLSIQREKEDKCHEV